jgi:HEAT repeats
VDNLLSKAADMFRSSRRFLERADKVNNMRKILFALALVIVLALSPFAQQAQAWVGVRIGIGVPLYVGPGPYYYGSPYYYAPPTYVVPAPQVIYQTPPATVAYPPAQAPSEAIPTAPAKSPAPAGQSAAPAPLPTVANVMTVNNQATPQVEALMQQLGQASETARRDAAIQLGRMKAQSAVNALVTILAKDSSPLAREGAARALGLIAAPASLNALIYAAQADDDREVRHSAQFAVEVIRSNLRGN